MQVAIAAAGFTAERGRRAAPGDGTQAQPRAHGGDLRSKMLDGMAAQRHPEDVASGSSTRSTPSRTTVFPRSHAASFALLVYASAYLKHYYAPEYTAAILNAQPMGFYSVGTLIEDARRHGVEVSPVMLRSPGLRPRWSIGMRERGKRRDEREEKMAPRQFSHPAALSRIPHPVGSARPAPRPGPGRRARENLKGAIEAGGPFQSIGDVLERSGPRSRRAALTRGERRARLLSCRMSRTRGGGARRSGGCSRRSAAMRGRSRRGRYTLEVPPPVPAMSAAEITAADYRMTGLSLNGHPMEHLRACSRENGVRSAREVLALPDGDARRGDGRPRHLPPAAGHGEGIRLPHAGG